MLSKGLVSPDIFAVVQKKGKKRATRKIHKKRFTNHDVRSSIFIKLIGVSYSLWSVLCRIKQQKRSEESENWFWCLLLLFITTKVAHKKPHH
ncbi:CLUMA_CG009450, isoform A [Clunio marinus]|uniref:CLUMA_CG009450, isoform A n=1 Tax=Clunio marinus TaxID=568069 RepID=A0A1J1I8F2_9DIPT|nr:CLUMA_CG009450, isoform A [Clunio marinus]